MRSLAVHVEVPPPVAPDPRLNDDDDLVEVEEDEDEEERELDRFAAELPLHDPDVPYRPERVALYMGSPGARVMCPMCDSHGRTNGWGEFVCDSCGFRNTVTRPVATDDDYEAFA